MTESDEEQRVTTKSSDRFMDPDPRGKISTKSCKKTFFTPKTQT